MQQPTAYAPAALALVSLLASPVHSSSLPPLSLSLPLLSPAISPFPFPSPLSVTNRSFSFAAAVSLIACMRVSLLFVRASMSL